MKYQDISLEEFIALTQTHKVVIREHRGHGYGRKMLALVERKVSVGTYLFGQVKQENQASRDIFLSLGYEERFSTDGAWWEYRKRVKCNLQEVK